MIIFKEVEVNEHGFPRTHSCIWQLHLGFNFDGLSTVMVCLSAGHWTNAPGHNGTHDTRALFPDALHVQIPLQESGTQRAPILYTIPLSWHVGSGPPGNNIKWKLNVIDWTKKKYPPTHPDLYLLMCFLRTVMGPNSDSLFAEHIWIHFR